MEPNELPPVAEAAAPPPEYDSAGVWVRFGALMIDALATTAVIAPVAILAGLVKLPAIVGGLLGVALRLGYHTFMVGTWGQTLGKMAAGAVVLTDDGFHVSYPRAFGRAAATYLSTLTLGLGYLMAALTRRKRALHDVVAGTRVVYRPGVGLGRKAAVTCVGLLPVSATFAAGLLLALNPALRGAFLGAFRGASPGRLAELRAKAEEGKTKAGLGMLRSGGALFYADTEGRYPARLEELVPKRLPAIPKLNAGPHGESDRWTAYGSEACDDAKPESLAADGAKLKDTGGWGYVADERAKCWGTIFVDCTHRDSRGQSWHSY
ncbi:MAG: RDD family protein [Elusimicrobia bacterium]|nr:RDD family protein [Elusimicrobiota bacterium]